jgi:hypothetical protein
VSGVQDLGGVRRLSAWRSAVRDLDEHVGELTSFGPRAVERVTEDLEAIEALEAQAHEAFRELAGYLRGQRGLAATGAGRGSTSGGASSPGG